MIIDHIIEPTQGIAAIHATNGDTPDWKVALPSREAALRLVCARLAEAEMEDSFYLTPAQTALVVGIAMEAYDAGEGAL
jgi:hypothetical protein